MTGKIVQGSAGYSITEACLHTSATGPEWWKGKSAGALRDEIRRWHIEERGWRDIGYHYVVAPDGTVATGRPLHEIPAQVQGHNRGVAGICLVPVREVTAIARFEDWYTPAQFKAVRGLLRTLQGATDLRRVTGHNQYAARLCPGFRVVSAEWMPA